MTRDVVAVLGDQHAAERGDVRMRVGEGVDAAVRRDARRAMPGVKRSCSGPFTKSPARLPISDSGAVAGEEEMREVVHGSVARARSQPEQLAASTTRPSLARSARVREPVLPQHARARRSAACSRTDSRRRAAAPAASSPAAAPRRSAPTGSPASSRARRTRGSIRSAAGTARRCPGALRRSCGL